MWAYPLRRLILRRHRENISDATISFLAPGSRCGSPRGRRALGRGRNRERAFPSTDGSSRVDQNSPMEAVWGELYRKKLERPIESFNPARLTAKSQAAAYREAANKLRQTGSDEDKVDADLLKFEAWLMLEIFPKRTWIPISVNKTVQLARFLHVCIASRSITNL